MTALKEQILALRQHAIWHTETRPREQWSEESQSLYVKAFGEQPPESSSISHFQDCVEIDFTWDPDTETGVDDVFTVVVYAGPPIEFASPSGILVHRPSLDPDLIVRAPTIPEALIGLAEKVKQFYDDQGNRKEAR